MCDQQMSKMHLVTFSPCKKLAGSCIIMIIIISIKRMLTTIQRIQSINDHAVYVVKLEDLSGGAFKENISKHSATVYT